MVNNNVKLTAICWTKTCGPWFTVNWAAYNHAKWPDQKVVHVVSYNTILVLQCQWIFSLIWASHTIKLLANSNTNPKSHVYEATPLLQVAPAVQQTSQKVPLNH